MRVAIGANARDILALVFRQGMVPVGVGILIGVAVPLGVTRVLESVLAQVTKLATPCTACPPAWFRRLRTGAK